MAILDNVYDKAKESFTQTMASALGVIPDVPYYPADELAPEEIQQVIEETNKDVTNAAGDNSDQIYAASRRANVLMAMARDNHSATAPRMKQVQSYLIYLERALYEGDANSSTDSDGMLLAGIKRVDL